MEEGFTVPFSKLVKSSILGIEMTKDSRMSTDFFCAVEADEVETLLSLLRFDVFGKR